MANSEFGANRSKDLEARTRQIEDQLVELSTELANIRSTMAQTSGAMGTGGAAAAGGGGGGGGGGSLAGDVIGLLGSNEVMKIRHTPVDAALAADDGEVLAYVHGSLAYVLKPPPFKAVAKTANYTATLDDLVILVDATAGAVTITLPTAASAKWGTFLIKKIDVSVNVVTIDGNGAETIDDAATRPLSVQYQALWIVSDGSEWWVV